MTKRTFTLLLQATPLPIHYFLSLQAWLYDIIIPSSPGFTLDSSKDVVIAISKAYKTFLSAAPTVANNMPSRSPSAPVG